MAKRAVWAILIGLCMVLGAGPAAAGGGILAGPEDDLNVAELRVLYVVDEAQNQTTITLEAALSGYASNDFGVLLPLPAAPLAVTTGGGKTSLGAYPWHVQIAGAFDLAFELPRQVLHEPPYVCRALIWTSSNCPHPYLGNSAYLDEEPRMFVTSDEVTAWAQQHGYDLPPGLLDDYAGWAFVALRAESSTEGDWGWLPLLSATYPGTETQLPLRVLGNRAQHPLYIEVAVLAGQPYTISNLAQVQPDPATLRRTSVLEFGAFFQQEYCASGYLVPASPLEKYYKAALQGTHQGQAFAIEYRGPVNVLLDPRLNGAERAEVADLVGDATHLSLFYMQMGRSQITVDPVLVPDRAGADVSNVLDLTGVNAFDYWGCSTAEDPAPAAEVMALLTEKTFIPALGKPVSHPPGWRLSQIPLETDNETGCDTGADTLLLDVLAARLVTIHDLRAALGGAEAPPMLVIAQRQDSSLAALLEVENPVTAQRSATRYEPFSGVGGACQSGVVQLWWLDTAADWSAHDATYNALFDEALSHRYDLDPDLPHTAFITDTLLSPYTAYTGLIAGYPDGWQITLPPDGQRHYQITPRDDPAGPRLDILGWEVVLGTVRSEENPELRGEQYDNWLAAVRDRYHLPPDFDLEARRMAPCYQTDLTWDQRLIPFEHDGRRGVFFLYLDYLIELSLPADSAEADWSTLRLMAEAIQFRAMCG